jgi:hypothetical protein
MQTGQPRKTRGIITTTVGTVAGSTGNRTGIRCALVGNPLACLAGTDRTAVRHDQAA